MTSYNYKAFVINLKSASDRRVQIEKRLKELQINYEIIDAVEGSTIDILDATTIDTEWFKRNAHWVSKGALACSLSHRKAMQAVIDQGLDYGLILEDDTLLEEQLPAFLTTAGEFLKNKEVVLLYYASMKSCKLSRTGGAKTEVPGVELVVPVVPAQVITANAYVLSKESCKSLITFQSPVKATADQWGMFYEKKVFSKILCCYPMLAEAADFKSTIDYIPNGSITSSILAVVDKFKIFPFFQILKYRRKKMRIAMLNFELTGS